MRKEVQKISLGVWFVLAALTLAAVPAAALEIGKVPATEVKQMIESGRTDFLVVDVQPKEVYDIEHVKGAISFPLDEGYKTPGSLPKDKLLILYCACSHDEDSTEAATQLIQKFGYKNVKLLEGGWIHWAQQKYPVERP